MSITYIEKSYRIADLVFPPYHDIANPNINMGNDLKMSSISRGVVNHDIKNKIKQKFVAWSQSSTSHGYPNIFRTKNMIVKMMWLIFFLAGLGVGIYMVIRGIRDYLEWNVSTTIRKIKNESLIFPAISICNINPFVTEAGALYILEHFRKTYNQNISSLLDAKRVSADLEAELEIVRQHAASPNFDHNRRRSFGYPIEKFLFTCSFNTVLCNFDEFERFLNLLEIYNHVLSEMT